MLSPEVYIRENSIQRRDARDLLNENIHLVKWSTTGDDVIMDIGCGPGDLTHELLKLKLRKYSRLIGADVSESMVQYARMHYPDIEFVTMDLAASHVPDNWMGKIDHIFSFFCLHWINDQRQAMKNLYNLLKPGGNVLMCYAGYSPVFDVYLSMAHTSIWKPYVKDVNKFISPYHSRQDAEESLREIILDVGFQISICESKTTRHEFENKDVFMSINSATGRSMTNNYITVAMNAIDPFLNKIPENMRKQYNSDYLKELGKLKIIEENNKMERVIFPHKLISICVTKPLK